MTHASPTDWIGRSETVADRLDPALAERVRVTLGGAPLTQNDPLPHLWQWAFFQNPVGMDGLGVDGHPQRGGFLPVAENRNRMWAGGRVVFHQPLRVGVNASRTSTVSAVEEKVGRTGALLFVTVKHQYRQDGILAIDEEQDIVYRAPSPPKLSGTVLAPEAQWHDTVEPSAELLFRYSAVTFNTHRIHYDVPYVTQEEGYPGLVVHGPMIATRMLAAFVQANPTLRVTRQAYRGLRPLISPAPFNVAGRIVAPGRADAWAEQDGTLAHQAEIDFE